MNKESNWIEIETKKWTFQYLDEPELIHIIKTGFKNKYMLVWEDAYEISIGKVEFHSKESIEDKYNIELYPELKGVKLPEWVSIEQMLNILEVRKNSKIKGLKMLKDLTNKHIEQSLKWSVIFLRKFNNDAETE